MNKWLIMAAVGLLSACALTPEQQAAREQMQRQREQALQVALADQCDRPTAELIRRKYADDTGSTKQEKQDFRLNYIDKTSDPLFQACYKLAWQNYISQQRLREMRYYHDDYWDDFYYPFRRPFRRW